MIQFVAAIAVFVASHVLVAYRPLRYALSERIGERAFLMLYGGASTALLLWLFWAYWQAPFLEVWEFRPWQRWVPVLAMPLSSLLIVFGLTTPNPLSLGWGSRGWSPERPGIVAVTRHPAVWGLIVWSAAHIPPNGDAASLLMFGLLTALGLYGPSSLDSKRRSRLGEAEWRRLAGNTSNIPFAAMLAGRIRYRPRAGDGWRLVGGIVLYFVLLFGHPWVIGVSPLP